MSEKDRAWIEADPTGRRKRLAFDPDSSQYRVNEAQAAIEAERQIGPLERAIDHAGRGGGGDYFDLRGVAWDVKQGSGGAGTILKAVIDDGENVIVDGRGLSAAQQARLRRDVETGLIEAGITGRRVIYVFFADLATPP